MSRSPSSRPTVTGPKISPGLNTLLASLLNTLASLYLCSSSGRANSLILFLASILISLICFLWSLLISSLCLTTSSLILFAHLLLSSSLLTLHHSLCFSLRNSCFFLTPSARLSVNLFSIALPTITLSLSAMSVLSLSPNPPEIPSLRSFS